MKTLKDMRDEIIQFNEAIGTAFIAYVDAKDSNAQKSYKRIIEYQRKTIEELIKLYWHLRDKEEDEVEDACVDDEGTTWAKRR